MLGKLGYKNGSYEKGLTNGNFYKYQCEEDHTINKYEGFHNVVIRMLTRGTLRLEGVINRKVSIVFEPSRNKKVYQVKLTTKRLPKLILSKPMMASKGNCNALPQKEEDSVVVDEYVLN